MHDIIRDMTTSKDNQLAALETKAATGDRQAIRDLRFLRLRKFAEGRLTRPHDATTGEPVKETNDE